MKETVIVLAIIALSFGRVTEAACWRDEEGTRWCDVKTQWRSLGENKNAIKYAEGCAFDFGGKFSLRTAPIPAEFETSSAALLCGTLCLKEEDCTHFTVSNGASCVLKSRARPAGAEPNKRMGLACGYISTRTDFAPSIMRGNN